MRLVCLFGIFCWTRPSSSSYTLVGSSGSFLHAVRSDEDHSVSASHPYFYYHRPKKYHVVKSPPKDANDEPKPEPCLGIPPVLSYLVPCPTTTTTTTTTTTPAPPPPPPPKIIAYPIVIHIKHPTTTTTTTTTTPPPTTTKKPCKIHHYVYHHHYHIRPTTTTTTTTTTPAPTTTKPCIKKYVSHKLHYYLPVPEGSPEPEDDPQNDPPAPIGYYEPIVPSPEIDAYSGAYVLPEPEPE